jgi:putative transposase
MRRSRFTDSQILAALKQAEAGTAVPDLCREHGISTVTFCKWRSKYGGMDFSLMTRMKELEEENRRLKKSYIEAQIKADIVRRPSQKDSEAISLTRGGEARTVEEKGLSIRLACEAFGMSETGYLYQPRHNAENAKNAEWLQRLT